MLPCSNQDWRPTHSRKTMHQQVPSPDAYRHREHNVLELLPSDRARVWDWDVDVGDFRSSVNGLFTAERNDGCDALRIGTRQLFCIFEAAEIEPFPNLRHLFPSGLTQRKRYLSRIANAAESIHIRAPELTLLAVTGSLRQSTSDFVVLDTCGVSSRSCLLSLRSCSARANHFQGLRGVPIFGVKRERF